MSELIAPTINFAILISLLVFFLRKPVREMVSTRHASIKQAVEEALQAKIAAEHRYTEFDKKLTAFENEAKQIVVRARQDGEAMQNKIIKEAHSNAERIMKEAEATVHANIQDYKDQIRLEIIHRAVQIAEKTIRERLSMDDQRRIVSEYVGKVQ